MIPRFLIMLFRIALGAVFIFGSMDKILFPGEFALAVFRYQILPHFLINPVAITLPWLELTAAIAVVFSYRFRDAAATIILVLLAVFTAGILVNLIRGADIACGCMTTSPVEDVISWTHVIRNMGYMLMTGVVLGEDRLFKHRGRVTPRISV